MSKELRIPFLGAIPLDADIVMSGDEGRPIVVDKPNSVAAQAYMAIATELASQLARKIHRIAHWATGFRFLVGGRRVGSYPVMSRSLRMWRLAG